MARDTDSIAKAIRRFREVQEIMAKAASVRQEYYTLDAFLTQAHTLFPEAFDEWPIPDITLIQPPPADLTHKPQKPFGKLRTSDYAEWVLKVHGQLHIRDLVKRMREEGWTGNKDDAKAEKTLFNIMADKEDRFQNFGKNVWGLATKDH
jgi:hypothetical protein